MAAGMLPLDTAACQQQMIADPALQERPTPAARHKLAETQEIARDPGREIHLRPALAPLRGAPQTFLRIRVM